MNDEPEGRKPIMSAETQQTDLQSNPPGQTLIPARLGALASLTSKDASRPYLGGICLTIAPESTTAVVSDGHQLTAATWLAAEHPVGDYPTARFGELPIPTRAAAILPARAWTELCAQATKVKSRTLPILAHGFVALNGTRALLASTDLDLDRTTDVEVLGRESFPTWEQLCPSDDPVASVTLDGHLLKRILDAWCAVGKNERALAVTIDLFGPNEPVRLTTPVPDVATLYGLVMPMRSGR